MREAWTFAERGTGRRSTAKSWPSYLGAAQALEELQKNARGTDRRLAPYLVVVKLNENTWGSSPGDVIM